jgi:hypothetical protein
VPLEGAIGTVDRVDAGRGHPVAVVFDLWCLGWIGRAPANGHLTPGYAAAGTGSELHAPESNHVISRDDPDVAGTRERPGSAPPTRATPATLVRPPTWPGSPAATPTGRPRSRPSSAISSGRGSEGTDTNLRRSAAP